MTSSKDHWEKVYTDKAPDSVSWYQPQLSQSVRLLKVAGLSPTTSVIDIGGGASTLVDDLLDAGCEDVTILDISAQALEVSKKRLGPRSQRVTWIAGDITKIALPPGAYDLWHDRAVFHFLISPDDRAKYRELMLRAIKPGGHAMIATFSLAGPERCSGLEICRYSPASLAKELGEEFTLIESALEDHQTPSGKTQSFQYSLFKRGGRS